jgi:hypothetical protein
MMMADGGSTRQDPPCGQSRLYVWSGYAYALAVTAVLAYFLLDLPIQVSDSFGNMLKLLGVSLGELVYNEFWQRAYLRPFLWGELKVVFDLADGNYSAWYRWVHVAQVGVLAVLFVRLVRPRAALDMACLPLGLAALVGVHTFAGTVAEAFPINTFLTVLVLAFAAAAVVTGPRRAWSDALLGLLLFIAALTVESGLLIAVIVVGGWLLRAPGVSRAGALIQVALVAGYLLLRFLVLDVGSPDLSERASGFGFDRLEPEALQQRFGANPLPFYAYNIVTSILSVLLSEPRAGVFRLTFGVTVGAPEAAMIVNVIASSLGTLVLGWFAWRRRHAWLAREFTHDDRLVLLFVLVLAANGAISYPYTKDVVMSPAGAFYAVALCVAVRHLAATVEWRGVSSLNDLRPHFSAVLVLAVVLSASWSIRYLGLHAMLRDQAPATRNEWASSVWTMPEQYRVEFSQNPDGPALMRQLHDDAIFERPALRPRLPNAAWTRLMDLE